jgi:hypothetical protein
MINAAPLPLYPLESPPLLFVLAQVAGWAVGPVWEGAENLASTGILSMERPARSGSLYMLRYPGPNSVGIRDNIPCVNRRWREADHSPPPTAKVQNK